MIKFAWDFFWLILLGMERFRGESGGEENIGGVPDHREASPEREVEMVEAARIRTVFSDPKILEKIADRVHSQGLVSGFSIEPIEAGYFHHGKRVTERQYGLDFLIRPDESEERKRRIIEAIKGEIGEKWETPDITQESVQINRELLGFIQRAEVEHKRFLKERRRRLTLTLSLLISIAGIVGGITERYAERREAKAVAAERAKDYKRLGELEQKIQEQVGELERKLNAGEPLPTSPTDMAAQESHEDLSAILKTVRDVEHQARKILEQGEK